jgi:iron complex transport system ATP-binding protein
MSAQLLRVHGISWRAGAVDVLDGIRFDVGTGEFVAIMGRNGAGKSTLLDLIAGLKAPASGDVLLEGRALRDWSDSERARLVTHLPQSLRADLSMRAEALVLMGRYVHASQWFESDTDRRLARASMERCGCAAFRDRALGTLSGGERQRVYLAACLAQQPRLLLLDEPTTFLDIDQQLQCFTLLRDEAGRGTACLAVTHDINLALTFCSRIIVLAEHRVAADVPTQGALDDSAWLRFFSDRLRVERNGPAGARVSYQ